jgi:hypothetical protein
VWSGTSFAAPLLAGRIAALLGALPEQESAAEAVGRTWAVLEQITDLVPD